MKEEMIEAFLQEMRKKHGDEIESVMLPEGTEEYVRSRMEVGDAETLVLMLRLGYLMGLNTGFALAENGQELSRGLSDNGPLQA